MCADETDTFQNGQTLIEVMIALTIFTIGILAVAALQSIGLKTMGTASRETRSSISAAGRIESILSKPYDHPQLMDGDGGYRPESPDHGPMVCENGISTIEWEVAEDSPIEDTKRVVVTVRPISQGKEKKATILEYVKAKEY